MNETDRYSGNGNARALLLSTTGKWMTFPPNHFQQNSIWLQWQRMKTAGGKIPQSQLSLNLRSLVFPLKPVSEVLRGCLSCWMCPYLPVHFESHVSDLSDSLEKRSAHSSLHVSAPVVFLKETGILFFFYREEAHITSTWDLWHQPRCVRELPHPHTPKFRVNMCKYLNITQMEWATWHSVGNFV